MFYRNNHGKECAVESELGQLLEVQHTTTKLISFSEVYRDRWNESMLHNFSKGEGNR